jgi:hypothetical protein
VPRRRCWTSKTTHEVEFPRRELIATFTQRQPNSGTLNRLAMQLAV